MESPTIERSQEEAQSGEVVSSDQRRKPPRSLEIAQRGIYSDKDFAQCMSALMSDLIEERLTPGVGNAVVNAGGKLLKLVELRNRYGRAGDCEVKMLELAPRPGGGARQ